MIFTSSMCMHCGRGCNCAPPISAFLPSTSALNGPGYFDLLEEDIERALRTKWETRLRLLDSIRPANQPKRTDPNTAHMAVFEPRHLAVRATRFRSVASSRPGYRGTTDGKRRHAPATKAVLATG